MRKREVKEILILYEIIGSLVIQYPPISRKASIPQIIPGILYKIRKQVSLENTERNEKRKG